jgi:hypothetical protein
MKYIVAFLVVVAFWAVAVEFQPQAREGWSDDDKSGTQYIFLPKEGKHGIAIDADGEFFCSKNTHQLWKTKAFLHVNLPVLEQGRAVPCKYRRLNYTQPWDKYTEV